MPCPLEFDFIFPVKFRSLGRSIPGDPVRRSSREPTIWEETGTMAGKDVDHGRFLQHFLENQTLLRAYLLTATGDLHEAEDLLQDVSRVLWENFGEYDPARSFRAWALGIARLELLKWRQKRARRRETLSTEALEALAGVALEIGDEARNRRAHLESCLERLERWMAEIIRLRYLEGLSLQDVARRLDKSFASIGMALMRARRMLRECVDHKVREVGT